MIGAVLCGGNSTRMGIDKGLLQVDDLFWAQISINNLTNNGITTILSVNENQFDTYSLHFANLPILIDKKTSDLKGPVLALLGIHEHYLTEDIFILACDMPLMKGELIKLLITKYASDTTFEAYFFTNNEEAEPLCAIYTAGGLAKILARYKRQQLARFSMKYILSLLNTCVIPLNEEQKLAFTNFNSPNDLSNFH
jgi:molybdopterin-guanine dinucleotide biosynthesis protein A